MRVRYLYIMLFVLLLASISLVIFFTIKSRDDMVKSVASSTRDYFHKLLKQDSEELLILSLALSNDAKIIQAINDDDEQSANRILIDISKRFNRYTNLKDLKLQIITKDKFIFARSWKSAFNGFPLWWFRDDLDEIVNKSEPKSSVEIGMMLTMRATSPIIKDGKVLAYIEVIQLLNDLNAKLRESGIELIALMDKKFLKEASLMRENRQIDEYVVANSNASPHYLDQIKTITMSRLKSEHTIYKQDILTLLDPIHNAKGKKIGYFILSVPPDTFKKISKNTLWYNSFFDDTTKLSSLTNEIYRKKEDKEIIETVQKLRVEDRAEFIQKARDILSNYTKAELIDLIIQNRRKSPKVGEIK